VITKDHEFFPRYGLVSFLDVLGIKSIYNDKVVSEYFANIRKLYDGFEQLKTLGEQMLSFPKSNLFLNKGPQHYRSRKVRKYFEKYKDTLIPVYLPTASPEFMVLGKCWNIFKNDLLVLT